MAHFMLNPLTLSNINRFQNSFAVRIRRKFVITLSLKIPPHLKYLVKCQKVMVSVRVSRMGKNGIVFVEPGAKVFS